MQKKIQKIEIKNSGCLYVTVEDLEDKTTQILSFFFLYGWRVKDATGTLLTAYYNDPEDTDKPILILTGEKIKSIQFDKYDCKIETENGFCIESFCLSNFAADYGFLSEEDLQRFLKQNDNPNIETDKNGKRFKNFNISMVSNENG